MINVSIQEMMDAGAHFGHQTKKWNPKMKPFIYAARSGIHIIDLQQTQELARKAFAAIEQIVARGEHVIFVGTKKQAQPVMEEQAIRCNMSFVTRRWLGGMLTNFNTIKNSVDKLRELETRLEKKDFAGYTKREVLGFQRKLDKLSATLGGIKNLRRAPGALFVVDPQAEQIAIHEAQVLGIPVFAVTDTNCDPDPIDYIIPANDDAIRSITYFASRVADACLAGLEKREAIAREDDTERKKGGRTREGEGPGKAYVSKADTLEEPAVAAAAEGFSATAEVVPEVKAAS